MSFNIDEIIQCPGCRAELVSAGDDYACRSCKARFPRSKHGQPDLRLPKEATCVLKIPVGRRLQPDKRVFERLKRNEKPDVDFSGVEAPYHLTAELLSHFPKGNGGIVLDLGCGTTIHRGVCVHAGFEYIGLDYDSKDATLLGDGHALPFKDESIDFVIAVAVLEHIQHPNVMLNEVFRVLKPGGKLIGKVSFLEPFHGVSFYHHTHMGVYNSLDLAGFMVERVSPDAEWPALKAISTMALFPRMPEVVSGLLYLPLQALHRIWWGVGTILRRSVNSSEATRLLLTSGSFTFIAERPARA